MDVKYLLYLTLPVFTFSLIVLLTKRKKFFIVSKVKKIIIYPIKSLKGIEVETAFVSKTGLKYGNFVDRGYILVDAEGRMVTQRQQPSLSLLSTKLVGDDIQVTAPDGSSIMVSMNGVEKSQQQVKHVKFWGQGHDYIETDEQISEWFATYLGKPGLKLAAPVNKAERSGLFYKDGVRIPDNKTKIFFQDSSPCMIINESSVDDLKERLPDYNITFRNFRPNILVRAPEYTEDDWKYVKTGEAVLERYGPCTRCIMTTNDPDKGEFMPANEPLETLKKYRVHEKKYGKSPMLGTTYKVVKEGFISCKDDIWAVLETMY